MLTAASAAIGAAIAWWHWRGLALSALAIVAAVLLLLAIFLPRQYAPVFAALDSGVQALLRAISWLLFGTVFGLVFILGRIVLALRRRDPLEQTPDPTRASYWHDASRPATSDPQRRFRAQF